MGRARVCRERTGSEAVLEQAAQWLDSSATIKGTMAQQRGSETLSLAVGEARKYLDTFMTGHGFRRIRKGVFEVDRSDDISLILEEAFTASYGDVHVNMLVYLDFLTVRPLLERLYGKKRIWPGLSQFHPETIFNNELKAYARYFEHLDQTSIDRLLGNMSSWRDGSGLRTRTSPVTSPDIASCSTNLTNSHSPSQFGSSR
ncbi:hypothetical protein [Mesorhizobium sp. M1378]|uniref:hypothetical protein n=1 Tax=Mesorhizobium sp. M1378 TaxID=2957092 RepID=UPI00333C0663